MALVEITRVPPGRDCAAKYAGALGAAKSDELQIRG
jgi:hypothetical protein